MFGLYVDGQIRVGSSQERPEHGFQWSRPCLTRRVGACWEPPVGSPRLLFFRREPERPRSATPTSRRRGQSTPPNRPVWRTPAPPAPPSPPGSPPPPPP